MVIPVQGPRKECGIGALIYFCVSKALEDRLESAMIHTEMTGFGSLSCGAGDTVGFTVSRRERGRSTRGLGFKALLKSAVARTINTENYGKLNGQEADDYEFTYYRTFDQIV